MDRERSRADQSQNDSASEDAALVGEPHMRIDHLTPPFGTSYFLRQHITFFNNYEIGWDIKVGKLTWKADVYTYVTGAPPNDPHFSQKGMIYVVMVHTGSVEMYRQYNSHFYQWQQLRFDLTLGSSGLQPILQLPSTGKETSKGHFDYEINFGQHMQMFRNNGNEAFTFDANYQETFTRIAHKQTGSRAGQIHFAMENLSPLIFDPEGTVEIYGLSVLTHHNPSAFPLTLNRQFHFKGRDAADGWGVGADFRINIVEV